ncbi:uncharacterized protein MONOS_826 [Monocercomonoides exilis]|uniref:uncharacterized protein n=1 Tax=Monocercomonoides exilis TaxID=2049356 RepID=UPI003559D596|nr:hypothetical protein MONOS_826 [Monocercomonoides exilis]|eukprot:MONOS_826.1-p1 / transcript=MONOS_826.1 / gene=MONOS_826 / organism=Monocercomonoides_exilis_PA203 / gene_product=unspecified product / transcript_product=unspecified product / location=Mono_scaffold00013:220571-225527(+) / protein_length=1606 / sequence_SO=supercontig / SO=protein_coding / is_pseudo=false
MTCPRSLFSKFKSTEKYSTLKQAPLSPSSSSLVGRLTHTFSTDFQEEQLDGTKSFKFLRELLESEEKEAKPIPIPQKSFLVQRKRNPSFSPTQRSRLSEDDSMSDYENSFLPLPYPLPQEAPHPLSFINEDEETLKCIELTPRVLSERSTKKGKNDEQLSTERFRVNEQRIGLKPDQEFSSLSQLMEGYSTDSYHESGFTFRSAGTNSLCNTPPLISSIEEQPLFHSSLPSLGLNSQTSSASATPLHSAYFTPQFTPRESLSPSILLHSVISNASLHSASSTPHHSPHSTPHRNRRLSESLRQLSPALSTSESSSMLQEEGDAVSGWTSSNINSSVQGPSLGSSASLSSLSSSFSFANLNEQSEEMPEDAQTNTSPAHPLKRLQYSARVASSFPQSSLSSQFTSTSPCSASSTPCDPLSNTAVAPKALRRSAIRRKSRIRSASYSTKPSAGNRSSTHFVPFPMMLLNQKGFNQSSQREREMQHTEKSCKHYPLKDATDGTNSALPIVPSVFRPKKFVSSDQLKTQRSSSFSSSFTSPRLSISDPSSLNASLRVPSSPSENQCLSFSSHNLPEADSTKRSSSDNQAEPAFSPSYAPPNRSPSPSRRIPLKLKQIEFTDGLSPQQCKSHGLQPSGNLCSSRSTFTTFHSWQTSRKHLHTLRSSRSALFVDGAMTEKQQRDRNVEENAEKETRNETEEDEEKVEVDQDDANDILKDSHYSLDTPRMCKQGSALCLIEGNKNEKSPPNSSCSTSGNDDLYPNQSKTTQKVQSIDLSFLLPAKAASTLLSDSPQPIDSVRDDALACASSRRSKKEEDNRMNGESNDRFDINANGSKASENDNLLKAPNADRSQWNSSNSSDNEKSECVASQLMCTPTVADCVQSVLNLPVESIKEEIDLDSSPDKSVVSHELSSSLKISMEEPLEILKDAKKEKVIEEKGVTFQQQKAIQIDTNSKPESASTASPLIKPDHFMKSKKHQQQGRHSGALHQARKHPAAKPLTSSQHNHLDEKKTRSRPQSASTKSRNISKQSIKKKQTHLAQKTMQSSSSSSTTASSSSSSDSPQLIEQQPIQSKQEEVKKGGSEDHDAKDLNQRHLSISASENDLLLETERIEPILPTETKEKRGDDDEKERNIELEEDKENKKEEREGGKEIEKERENVEKEELHLDSNIQLLRGISNTSDFISPIEQPDNQPMTEEKIDNVNSSDATTYQNDETIAELRREANKSQTKGNASEKVVAEENSSALPLPEAMNKVRPASAPVSSINTKNDSSSLEKVQKKKDVRIFRPPNLPVTSVTLVSSTKRPTSSSILLAPQTTTRKKATISFSPSCTFSFSPSSLLAMQSDSMSNSISMEIPHSFTESLAASELNSSQSTEKSVAYSLSSSSPSSSSCDYSQNQSTEASSNQNENSSQPEQRQLSRPFSSPAISSSTSSSHPKKFRRKKKTSKSGLRPLAGAPAPFVAIPQRAAVKPPHTPLSRQLSPPPPPQQPSSSSSYAAYFLSSNCAHPRGVSPTSYQTSVSCVNSEQSAGDVCAENSNEVNSLTADSGRNYSSCGMSASTRVSSSVKSVSPDKSYLQPTESSLRRQKRRHSGEEILARLIGEENVEILRYL